MHSPVKKIGIIGGLGAEATAFFYRAYVNEYKRLNNNRYPQLYIYSLPISGEIEEAMIARGGDLNTIDTLKKLIDDAMASFETIGVQEVTILCNTLSPLVGELSKIKFVSLIDSVINAIRPQKSKRIMLLGSAALIKSNLYQRLLADNSIHYIEPCDECQYCINELILHILNNSEDKKHEEQLVKDIIKFSNKGDILLLACTDLSILSHYFNKYDVEYIDSLSTLLGTMLSKDSINHVTEM